MCKVKHNCSFPNKQPSHYNVQYVSICRLLSNKGFEINMPLKTKCEAILFLNTHIFVRKRGRILKGWKGRVQNFCTWKLQTKLRLWYFRLFFSDVTAEAVSFCTFRKLTKSHQSYMFDELHLHRVNTCSHCHPGDRWLTLCRCWWNCVLIPILFFTV